MTEVPSTDMKNELEQQLLDDFIRAHLKEILDNKIKPNYVVWSPDEIGWLSFKEEAETAPPSPLRVSIDNMMRKSYAGCFIKKMNLSDNSDYSYTEKKLDISDFNKRHQDSPKLYRMLHIYSEDFYTLLHTVVKQANLTNKITRTGIIENMRSLRVCSQKVTQMDTSLKKHNGLLALVVSFNYIHDFYGHALPPNLRFAEFFGNLMYDIKKLLTSPPVNLYYLGLGRNYLFNVESLRGLNQFTYLYFLDLSENDFEDLRELLYSFKELKCLKCLSLHGNPCSLSRSYPFIVKRFLPQIEALDGLPIVESVPQDPNDDDYNGYLQIHTIKFTNLPRHGDSMSSQKGKISRYYQIEVEIPMLDENLLKYEGKKLLDEIEKRPTPPAEPPVPGEIKNIENLMPPPTAHDENEVDGESVDQQEIQIKKIVRSYMRWLKRDKEIPNMARFYSAKVPYSTSLTFKNPCIEVPVMPHMLKYLRDTMRSVIPLRLYYKETVTIKTKLDSKREKNKEPEPKEGEKKSPKDEKPTQGAGKRKSMKRQSVKRKSMKRQSVKRKSMKRQSMKRGSVKRQSMKGGSAKRQSIKTGSQSAQPSDKKELKNTEYKTEEILVKRNLVAKILVPMMLPKWKEPSVEYMWNCKERCMAQTKESLINKEKGKKDGSPTGKKDESPTGKKDGSPGGKKQTETSPSGAGKRKSVARQSTTGKRKSMARKSTTGKRKSMARKSTTGKRKSMARKSTTGKRKSMGGKRQSMAGKRKSMGGATKESLIRSTKKSKESKKPSIADIILNCELGVGVRRDEARAKSKDIKTGGLAGKRKSKAPGGGKRKSKVPSSGKRKSKVPSSAKRKSKVPTKK